jgi:putative transposase
MAVLPGVHHRRSIRLKGYDYTQAGAYFITIVTHDRQRLFGRIISRRMRLSPFGEIARDAWLESPLHQSAIVLDAFVVMPDHFHGIVIVRDGGTGDGPNMMTDRRGTACRAPSVADIDIRAARHAPIDAADCDVRTACRAPIHMTHIGACAARRARTDTTERFGHPVPGSIPTIVRSFKSAATKRINERRGTPGALVWQRNYYERIIRNEFAMQRVRRYIMANPRRGR